MKRSRFTEDHPNRIQAIASLCGSQHLADAERNPFGLTLVTAMSGYSGLEFLVRISDTNPRPWIFQFIESAAKFFHLCPDF